MDVASGKYWEVFRDRFAEYLPVLGNDAVIRLTQMSQDSFFESPHLLLYGNSPTVLGLMSRTIVETVMGTKSRMMSASYEVTSNNNKYSCPYLHCATHMEINMAEIKSAEKQFVCDFIHKHISTTKSMNQRKHIVVMHNVDTLSTQSSFALRRPIESAANNVMFIFTCPTLANLETAILSRFCLVRCNFTTDTKTAFLERFAQDQCIDGDILMDPNDCIVLTLLSISCPEVRSTTEKVVKTFLADLFKEKNILKACDGIRTFAYKILHFNVPIATVMKTVITALGEDKSFRGRIAEVVQLSADLECKSHHVSKVCLVLEHYFLRLYNMKTAK